MGTGCLNGSLPVSHQQGRDSLFLKTAVWLRKIRAYHSCFTRAFIFAYAKAKRFWYQQIHLAENTHSSIRYIGWPLYYIWGKADQNSCWSDNSTHGEHPRLHNTVHSLLPQGEASGFHLGGTYYMQAVLYLLVLFLTRVPQSHFYREEMRMLSI